MLGCQVVLRKWQLAFGQGTEEGPSPPLDLSLPLLVLLRVSNT